MSAKIKKGWSNGLVGSVKKLQECCVSSVISESYQPFWANNKKNKPMTERTVEDRQAQREIIQLGYVCGLEKSWKIFNA